MSYPPFRDDEGGIRVAQRALDDVRGFLRGTGTSSMSRSDDNSFVLRLQLESLEDMLREITDSRLARRLSGDDMSVATNTNVENLRFIITTAREIQISSVNRAPSSNGMRYRSPSSGLNLGNTSARDDLISFSPLRPRIELIEDDEYESVASDTVPSPLSEVEEEPFPPPFRSHVGNIKNKQREITSEILREVLEGSSTSLADRVTSYSPPWDAASLSGGVEPDSDGDNNFFPWIEDEEHDDLSRSPIPSTSLTEVLRQYMLRDETIVPEPEPSSPATSPPAMHQASVPRRSLMNLSPLYDDVELDLEEYSWSPRQISENELSDSEELQEDMLHGFEESHSPRYSGNPSSRSTNSAPCIACGDTDLSDPVSVTCGHLYCKSCISDLVSLYVRDESLHPLRCCKTLIPFAGIMRMLLGTENLSLFQDKHEEYNTPFDDRIYCPQQGCSRFIKSQNSSSAELSLTDDQGKLNTVRCSDCAVWVCVLCKELAHPGEGCHVKKNTILLHELAKEKDWQTCSNCRSIVERLDGCLHMVCRCGFEFCYRCGEKYTGPGMCGH